MKLNNITTNKIILFFNSKHLYKNFKKKYIIFKYLIYLILN
jgi:hypothetical protein